MEEQEQEQKTDGYKQAQSGEIIKLDTPGLIIEGIYLGYEESKQFPGSWALRIKIVDDIKVVFVNNIVVDLIESNNIKKNQEIKLEFLGMKKAEKSGREYKDFNLYYK